MRCDGKAQYPSRILAERAVKRSRRATGDLISPYWCERHQCWHQGHSPLARGLRAG